MILNALVEYYDRLEADPEHDVAPFGFSRQKISFEVVLNLDGSLHAFQDARRESESRRIPRSLVVPDQAKPSGSGINPCFLWDNAQYMLGYKPDDPKPDRTGRAFEAFRDRHLALEQEIGDDAFSAVCQFLRTWDPARAAEFPELPEIAGSFGVFRILGSHEYVHEREKVLAYWRGQIDAGADAMEGPSLISGTVQPLARLHQPLIKGVVGAQPSGAAIVSFNLDAFESYGKSQSFNAPVGVEDAFKYCTALNRLLSDKRRRVQLSDATVVFWTERPTGFELDISMMFAEQRAAGASLELAEDQKTIDRVRGFLNRLKAARAGDRLEDADVRFYVLGLSPNASRISIRLWQAGTVQQSAERLGQHLADLELDYRRPDARPLTLRQLVLETARPKKGWPDEKSVSPLLAGTVFRSILSGGPYPQSLFTAVLERIRAEGFAHKDKRRDWLEAVHRRAAILKAYLVRKARLAGQKEEDLVSLNKDHPNPAYHLGRLFAVLEKTQEEAYDNQLNTTIKDRYFSSASAAPVTAFPRLLRLHAHHLEKIEHPGRRTNLEKLIQEICAHLEGFPGHLPLDEQGLFFIGYYHQRQAFFTSTKSDTEAPAAATTEE